eukprot:922262-Pelagomonas_calceolata.AAC.5
MRCCCAWSPPNTLHQRRLEQTMVTITYTPTKKVAANNETLKAAWTMTSKMIKCVRQATRAPTRSHTGCTRSPARNRDRSPLRACGLASLDPPALFAPSQLPILPSPLPVPGAPAAAAAAAAPPPPHPPVVAASAASTEGLAGCFSPLLSPSPFLAVPILAAPAPAPAAAGGPGEVSSPGAPGRSFLLARLVVEDGGLVPTGRPARRAATSCACASICCTDSSGTPISNACMRTR